MEFEIKADIQGECEYLVKDTDTAKFLGSGDVEVLATPAMIAFMEECCLRTVQPSLPDGYTTVGIKVCISHLAAAPKGAKIKVLCKLIKQEERKLEFAVEAWWKETKIGEGEHQRFIVNKERFINKLKETMAKE